ncbi:MAG TPA: hypothetical protein EYG03_10435 [Planctomycetes bacterium]|nr:hypothetical protein [Fuerstiella sp.]HIK92384.1 hypothetical protein [Planctomycetota bacterium]
MPQNSSAPQASAEHRPSDGTRNPSERRGGIGVDTTRTARSLVVCVSFVVCCVVYLQIARFSAAHAIEPQVAGSQDKSLLKSNEDAEGKPAFRTELIRGQVVWLAAALKSKFGISTVPEVAEHSLALLTKDGHLLPIVENLRGRAFRKDARLRGKDTEILVRRYDNQPLIQILRVYEIEDGQRYEVDYWCDICAIVMFETGPCACCQDDNRLRKRLAADDDQD